jgi:transcriptional regulator with XRE-family HTH domain
VKKKASKKRVKIYDVEGLTLLAKRIKELREEQDITQEEFSYRSGLSLSQIARIETVKGNPTVSTLFTIARALKIRPKELFDF